MIRSGLVTGVGHRGCRRIARAGWRGCPWARPMIVGWAVSCMFAAHDPLLAIMGWLGQRRLGDSVERVLRFAVGDRWDTENVGVPSSRASG